MPREKPLTANEQIARLHSELDESSRREEDDAALTEYGTRGTVYAAFIADLSECASRAFINDKMETAEAFKSLLRKWSAIAASNTSKHQALINKVLRDAKEISS
jgi:hypothetical protein